MFLPLYCLSFCLRLLITPSSFSCLYVLAIVLCVLRFTISDYPFKLFFVFMFLPLYCVSFGLRLLVTPSSFVCLYVLAIVLPVLRFTLLIISLWYLQTFPICVLKITQLSLVEVITSKVLRSPPRLG